MASRFGGGVSVGGIIIGENLADSEFVGIGVELVCQSLRHSRGFPNSRPAIFQRVSPFCTLMFWSRRCRRDSTSRYRRWRGMNDAGENFFGVIHIQIIVDTCARTVGSGDGTENQNDSLSNFESLIDIV